MSRLKNKLNEEQEKDVMQEKEAAKKVVKKISGDSEKDKMISAKVNSQTYTQFTKINQLNGMSNNSVINMLITKYVRENKHLLDE